jgi:hypothetical protein
MVPALPTAPGRYSVAGPKLYRAHGDSVSADADEQDVQQVQ